MLRPVLVLLGCWLWWNSAWGQACTDVRAVDFKNAAIRTGPPGPNEAGLLLNGATPAPESFELHNGGTMLHDDPDAKPSSSADWQIRLAVDRRVRTDEATWVRVIVLDEYHLSGTGTWEVIQAYACKRGHLLRLMQYSGLDVSLTHVSPQRVDLYQPIWKASDPQCCPTRHLELGYAWDPAEHRYRRAMAAVRNGYETAPDER